MNHITVVVAVFVQAKVETFPSTHTIVLKSALISTLFSFPASSKLYGFLARFFFAGFANVCSFFVVNLVKLLLLLLDIRLLVRLWSPLIRCAPSYRVSRRELRKPAFVR